MTISRLGLISDSPLHAPGKSFAHDGARPDREPEGGFALVAVLWFLLLVAAVVTPFAIAARTDFLISLNRREKARLDLLADAVSTLVSLRLTDRSGNNDAFVAELPLNSSPISCSDSKYSIDIRLQDQAGLIDLNVADEALLAIGLRSIGVTRETGGAVAKAIIGYRSYDPDGWQGRSIVAIAGGLKGGPFESAVELSDFGPLGSFEPADFHRAFTVHSGQDLAAISRSPPELADLLKASADIDGSSDVGGSPAFFALEVTVRDRKSAIKGYAGFLVQPSDPPNPPFRRVEQLFEPSVGANEAQPGQRCPPRLQEDIAVLLSSSGQ